VDQVVVVQDQELEQVELVIHLQLVHLKVILVEHRQMELSQQELAEEELEQRAEMLHHLLGFHLRVQLV
tara:strand:+ start:282 stop:488 length:207 start_codon:yes stop_codon:yes gene_type:complete